jgi:hypothetical protein
MKRQEIIGKLLKEGFSEKTLVNFTDNQLNTLSSRILGESEVMISKSDPKMIEKIDLAKKEKKTIETYESKNLKGDQKKLDKNNNGRLDSQDFKILRSKKTDKKPSSDIEEAKHATKDLSPFIKWLKSKHGWTDENTKKGFSISPPTKDKGLSYYAHNSDKGLYDIMRHVAKHYEVSKKEVEDAYRQNVKIKTSNKNRDIKEWINNLAEGQYHSFTSKNEIIEMIKNKINEQEFGSNVTKGHNNIPEFMSSKEILGITKKSETSGVETAPTPVKTPDTKPSIKPRDPFRPKPGKNPKPKAKVFEEKKKK